MLKINTVQFYEINIRNDMLGLHLVHISRGFHFPMSFPRLRQFSVTEFQTFSNPIEVKDRS